MDALDKNGLKRVWEAIKTRLADKADKKDVQTAADELMGKISRRFLSFTAVDCPVEKSVGGVTIWDLLNGHLRILNAIICFAPNSVEDFGDSIMGPSVTLDTTETSSTHLSINLILGNGYVLYCPNRSKPVTGTRIETMSMAGFERGLKIYPIGTTRSDFTSRFTPNCCFTMFCTFILG